MSSKNTIKFWINNAVKGTLVPVVSDLISHLGYDLDCKTLFFRYCSNGNIYAYANVEPELYLRILLADSVGSALHHAILDTDRNYIRVRNLELQLEEDGTLIERKQHVLEVDIHTESDKLFVSQLMKSIENTYANYLTIPVEEREKLMGVLLDINFRPITNPDQLFQTVAEMDARTGFQNDFIGQLIGGSRELVASGNGNTPALTADMVRQMAYGIQPEDAEYLEINPFEIPYQMPHGLPHLIDENTRAGSPFSQPNFSIREPETPESYQGDQEKSSYPALSMPHYPAGELQVPDNGRYINLPEESQQPVTNSLAERDALMSPMEKAYRDMVGQEKYDEKVLSHFGSFEEYENQLRAARTDVPELFDPEHPMNRKVAQLVELAELTQELRDLSGLLGRAGIRPQILTGHPLEKQFGGFNNE